MGFVCPCDPGSFVVMSRLGSSTASKTYRDLFKGDRGESTEAIYSSIDQDYDSREKESTAGEDRRESDLT